MESPKKYRPYNQYIPHKDVVYSLIGYHVYLGDQATYPSYGTHKIEESLHHTLDDAKKRMTELINNKRHPVYKCHRFLIYEVPLGIHYSSGWDGQRCWTYDRKGEFVAESKVSSVPDIHDNMEIYWGREPEECRFKDGRVRRSSDPNMTTRSHYTAPSGKSRARTSSVTPFMRQSRNWILISL